jgi:hypothetical protein
VEEEGANEQGSLVSDRVGRAVDETWVPFNSFLKSHSCPTKRLSVFSQPTPHSSFSTAHSPQLNQTHSKSCEPASTARAPFQQPATSFRLHKIRRTPSWRNVHEWHSDEHLVDGTYMRGTNGCYPQEYLPAIVALVPWHWQPAMALRVCRYGIWGGRNVK